MTHGGARAIRRAGELGQLRGGAQSDIISLDIDTWAFTPSNELETQLIDSEDGRSVRSVIVAGELLIENRHHLRLKASQIRAEIRALAQAIEAQMRPSQAAAQRLRPCYRAMYERAHAVPSGMLRRLLAGD